MDNQTQIEAELNARLTQQEALADLGQQALVTPDLDSLMKEVVQMTVRILGVDFCELLELLPDGKELLLRTGAGWKEGRVGRTRISAGSGSQAGYTFMTGGPVIMSDMRTETRFTSPLLLEHNVISGMTVVISGREKPFGVLGAHTDAPRVFTKNDTHFLKSVANILASAIERFRIEEQLRASRDEFSIILKGIADGITVQDQSGKLVYMNLPAAYAFGYNSVEEALNFSNLEILSKFEIFDEVGNPFPLDQLPGRLALQGVRNPAATVRFKYLATSEERWAIVKATPVFDASGQIVQAVNIFQDITELKRIENVQRLLSEAGRLLANSLDYETSLSSVARLIVPNFADWCSVDILEEDETIQQVAVAHVDPDKIALARELRQRYPIERNSQSGVAIVLRTGRPISYKEITEESIRETAEDHGQYELFKDLGLKSVLIVPLTARGRTVGALTMVWAESGRNFNEADVALAEELAARAALAIDNANLYRQAQALNTELEQRVAKRTNQLQTIINKLRSEINDRKRAEDALRESETLLTSLFESAPDATILVDQTGTIRRVNAQTEKIFGYGRDELVGQKVDFMLPNRFQPRHGELRNRYFSEPSSRLIDVGLELYGLRKDGEEFPVDIMISPVEIDEGRFVISSIRDITDRKLMEAELSEVQRRLIESVESERTYLAQELHDGPIQDLYAVSFQLKSMNSIPGSEEEGEGLVMAADTVQQVISILRSICGELRPPALAPFGLQKAIEGYLEQIIETHPELEVQADLMPDGQELPERLRLGLYRIFQHAVSNVVRHSGALHLDVNFTFNDHQVVLEVQDDGRGFVLPERWVDLAREGHLGIVGTAERAEALGGDLNIISEPGKGTLVRVIVPRNEGQDKYSRWGFVIAKPGNSRS